MNDEAVFRKDFTPSERVAIGEAIEAQVRKEAEERMKAGVANPTENFPEGKGETRDFVAKATANRPKASQNKATQPEPPRGRHFQMTPKHIRWRALGAMTLDDYHAFDVDGYSYFTMTSRRNCCPSLLVLPALAWHRIPT